ncbi:RraA family protein [Leptothoe sp. ISB3NOV94-8A]|uniref:Putative 4-hydroxy-4-methyl-2-oxoglutarate aldolase n=1 Tax=Adonisia turfae CCMR0081 TaxID=2292702 RepID=A0A6M0RXI5_9CYAN|nr:RraA family protein [Adonisia turfae]MDV3352417.1 RraA family protein [Leptothoe sp. LEGE 181152]NEZ60866.1 RraA family protein [Adonisia turfae CCMR0081]
MTDFPTIFQNQYSCALLADAAFRAGISLDAAPSGLTPIDRAMKLAGPMVTIQANNDLVTILTGIHQASTGDVIVITNHSNDVALIGDLIATEASRKGIAGIIVDGLVRDTTELIEIGVPIFCRGVYPMGPLKLPQNLKGIGDIGLELTLGDTTVKSGDWAFGDADGVIFIGSLDLPELLKWAEQSYQREESLAAQIRSGISLGELLDLDTFMEERAANPQADFNQHIAKLGQAI